MHRMKLFLISTFLYSQAWADFTVHQNQDQFVIFEAQLVPNTKPAVLRSPNREVHISYENLVRYNQNDLAGLLKRKSFKIKIADIQKISNKGK